MWSLLRDGDTEEQVTCCHGNVMIQSVFRAVGYAFTCDHKSAVVAEENKLRFNNLFVVRVYVLINLPLNHITDKESHSVFWWVEEGREVECSTLLMWKKNANCCYWCLFEPDNFVFQKKPNLVFA